MNTTELENQIFDRKLKCPICGNEFTTKSVKVNAVRISSKDSDFFVRYSSANPYFYDVWVCNLCGYAAMKSDFEKVKSYEKDLIISNISNKWSPRRFPEIVDPTVAIDKYKLALISATSMEKSNGTIAFILLKIAWMYRLLNDSENELLFMKRSLDCFIKAFTNESFPIYGLQRDSLTYLIGDLYRRTGNNDEALLWYSKVITTIGASQKIKELARDGRDIIKNN